MRMTDVIHQRIWAVLVLQLSTIFSTLFFIMTPYVIRNKVHYYSSLLDTNIVEQSDCQNKKTKFRIDVFRSDEYSKVICVPCLIVHFLQQEIQ